MDSRLRSIAEYLLARRRADEVKPFELPSKLLPQIYVLEIEGEGEHLRLRVRLTGSGLDAFFKQSLQGRYLDEFIHGPRSEQVMRAFQGCASSHDPLWMRQIVALHGRPPRVVEGIVVWLAPARLYGGLLLGELVSGGGERAAA